MMARFARFGTVGFGGSVLNLSLFWLLSTALNMHHVLASAIAFEVALCSNYVLNHRWTFADRCTARAGLLRYQIAALGGLCISLAVLHIGVALCVPPMLANALGIAAAMVSNFCISVGWTWRSTSAIAPQPA